jgi:hypothetical protein
VLIDFSFCSSIVPHQPKQKTLFFFFFHSVPETAAVAENSAKRNILRKGKTGGPKGKFKSKITEDGSSVLIEPRPALDPVRGNQT